VLEWAVAGDERWYVPRDERTVRQELMRGVPVLETRVRVGTGDAVHRAYAVADAGGLTVVEVENLSPQPFAVAFTRRDVWTSRPIPETRVVGVDLPPGSWIAPVGHRTRVRIALAHRAPAPGRLPGLLPTADQVARGWELQVETASRFDGGPAADVPVAALRAALLLDGHGGPAREHVGFLLGARELVELGSHVEGVSDDVAAAAERIGRRHRGADAVPWDADAAVEAAGQVLRAVGDVRAARDAAALRRALPPATPPPPVPPAGPVTLAWLRRTLAVDDRAGAVDLLPAPLARGVSGSDLSVHGLAVGEGTVSFAVRWHGERPALLWEAQGIRRLTCTGLDPTWSTSQPTGEALLPQTR
jgi:hypothetical protein